MRHVIFIAVLSAGLASCSGGSDGPQVRPGDSDGGGGDVDPVLLVLGDSLSDTGNAAALADYLRESHRLIASKLSLKQRRMLGFE